MIQVMGPPSPEFFVPLSLSLLHSLPLLEFSGVVCLGHVRVVLLQVNAKVSSKNDRDSDDVAY